MRKLFLVFMSFVGVLGAPGFVFAQVNSLSVPNYDFMFFVNDSCQVKLDVSGTASFVGGPPPVSNTILAVKVTQGSQTVTQEYLNLSSGYVFDEVLDEVFDPATEYSVSIVYDSPVGFYIVATPPGVFTDTTPENTSCQESIVSNGGSSGSGGGSGSSTTINVPIENPITPNSIPEIIQSILEGLVKIGIPLLVVMIVYSGALFLFARGNSSKITLAKTSLLYTLIGGAILLGAWALAQLIQSTLIDITTAFINWWV